MWLSSHKAQKQLELPPGAALAHGVIGAECTGVHCTAALMKTKMKGDTLHREGCCLGEVTTVMAKGAGISRSSQLAHTSLCQHLGRTGGGNKGKPEVKSCQEQHWAGDQEGCSVCASFHRTDLTALAWAEAWGPLALPRLGLPAQLWGALPTASSCCGNTKLPADCTAQVLTRPGSPFPPSR